MGWKPEYNERRRESNRAYMREYNRRPEVKERRRRRSRERYAANREEIRKRLRNNRLVTEYGITSDEYDELLQQQGGVCAICGSECPTGNRLAVDHCHETGAVRGLLCLDCNSGLGRFKDSLERLASARQYLEDHV